MSKSSLLISVEFTINDCLKRLSKIDGKNKESLKSEFKEWISAIDSYDKNYDVLYINRINSDNSTHEGVNLDR